MKTYDAGKFDIAVIGAGHAGIEAALAAARLGLRTVSFTVNLDSVGNMPCNPAIGGTGKGHLVRELDALGGEMGKAADAAGIQFRMLNRGKGPAVYSLRVQADRRRYQEIMKETLETQENLVLHQAEIVSIGLTDGHVSSVTTHTGAVYAVRCCHRYGDISRRADDRRRRGTHLRPGRTRRGDGAHEVPRRYGSSSPPLQDRHAAARERAQRPL